MPKSYTYNNANKENYLIENRNLNISVYMIEIPHTHVCDDDRNLQTI